VKRSAPNGASPFRLRYFEFYEDIPRHHRAAIQKSLGLRNGVMRTLADYDNARCVVAFLRNKPIGWATLLPTRRNHRREGPWLNIYVLPKHRRKGLGRALMRRMVGRANLWGRPCCRTTHSLAATRFFLKTGFTS
jgi:GNAT superfamily N-acetyltransferase